MLEWAQHKDGNWCTPYVKTFCVVHHEGRGWTLNYDDWDGPELGSDFDTADEAKALAQRLQDVLDGRDAVSEAVERIVSVCEEEIREANVNYEEDNFDAGVVFMAQEILALLRSRDWSKGEDE